MLDLTFLASMLKPAAASKSGLHYAPCMDTITALPEKRK